MMKKNVALCLQEEGGDEWEDTPVMVTRGVREGKKNLTESC
jgi:hypothetical protein